MMVDTKDMVITDVRTRVFRYTSHVRRAHGHSYPSPPRDAYQSVLEIRTRGGQVGHAFGMDPKVTEEIVAPALVGEDAAYRELLFYRLAELQRGVGGLITDPQLGLVDVALWDLAGQVHREPVHRLLGAYRDRVPAYASTMCGDDDLEGGLTSPEAYADFAEHCHELGYRAFKLHTWMPPHRGAPSVDLDIAACTAVRDRVGDRMELMLDPYHCYSREEAKRLGRALEELGFLWLEEPMREQSISSYAWLTSELEISIVGPETAPGQIWTRAEWILRNASDILRGGVLDLGGITPMMKVVHLAEAHNISVEIHSPGAASLQVLGAMSIPGRYYERGLLHPLLDYEARTPWLARPEDPLAADGTVGVPGGPGMGWEIDWDFIDANEVR